MAEERWGVMSCEKLPFSRQENVFAARIVHLFKMLDVVCFCSGGAGWWGSWGSQFIADVRNKVLCTDKLTVI